MSKPLPPFTLGAGLEAFVADLVASGAYADANEVVVDALRPLEVSLDAHDQRVVDARIGGPFSSRGRTKRSSRRAGEGSPSAPPGSARATQVRTLR
jgi:Arc/MetJ-type ribon-helix-helix transcriptional regulator